MRNLNFGGIKVDKKYLLAFIITLICSIICGIVLYKPVTSNVYLRNFAEDYVYNVFCFQNAPLLLTHLIGDLIYLYLTFLLCYLTKFKYLTLIFVFLRGLFFGIYFVILVGVNSFGGIIVATIVFLPSTLISLALCYVLADLCKCVYRKYLIFFPVIFSLIDLTIYALLINVIFRIIIVVV